MKRLLTVFMLSGALALGNAAFAEEAAPAAPAATPAVTAPAAASAAAVPATAVEAAKPAPAAATPAAVPNKGDNAWIMVCAAFVILMSIPGLALFYGGLVRTKNMLSVLMQVFH